MTDIKLGFAALTPQRRREIARRGGKAPRKSPTGFAAIPREERKRLGRLGGLKSKKRKKVTDNRIKEETHND